MASTLIPARRRAAAALLLATAMGVMGSAATAGPRLVDPSVPTVGSSPAATPTAPVEVAPGVSVPDFATRAWVLADMDTGDILAQLNPHERLRPASTLKLLTALTVAPRLAADQLYRADKADEVADGNRVVLYDGLTYKVSDLLHAALLPSANDAAMALAKANGGAARTVVQMNEEAARLGATDTTAVNPSGLDADGQFTSAHDLATIGRAVFDNPELAAYLKLRLVDFPGKLKADGSRVIYPIYSHNTMLRSGFKGSLGGKSGYTTLAHRTMVAAAERGGRRLIVSLMDIGGNTYRTAEQLLNWGFAHQDQLSAVAHLPQPSAPAPTFPRTIVPLADASAAPTGDVGAGQFAGSPGGAAQPAKAASGQSVELAVPPAPEPAASESSGGGWVSWLLTLMTIAAAAVAVARARVFWLAWRSRSRVPSRSDRPDPGPASSAPRTRRPADAGSRTRSLVDSGRR